MAHQIRDNIGIQQVTGLHDQSPTSSSDDKLLSISGKVSSIGFSVSSKARSLPFLTIIFYALMCCCTAHCQAGMTSTSLTDAAKFFHSHGQPRSPTGIPLLYCSQQGMLGNQLIGWALSYPPKKLSVQLND